LRRYNAVFADSSSASRGGGEGGLIAAVSTTGNGGDDGGKEGVVSIGGGKGGKGDGDGDDDGGGDGGMIHIRAPRSAMPTMLSPPDFGGGGGGGGVPRSLILPEVQAAAAAAAAYSSGTFTLDSIINAGGAAGGGGGETQPNFAALHAIAFRSEGTSGGGDGGRGLDWPIISLHLLDWPFISRLHSLPGGVRLHGAILPVINRMCVDCKITWGKIALTPGGCQITRGHTGCHQLNVR
jgi:hypothetical protein